jgi:ABC-type dipeptide/oligopeptide/nickel transport system ATPase component
MSSGGRVVETIWSKVESNPSLITAAGQQPGDAVSSETTTLIVGNAGSGKSTLINSAFKASSSKQPRPTFALEYTFARKKVGSGAAAGKSVAHVWELGGSIDEPKLLSVPITARNVASASLIVCIDLSQPKNILSSARRWVRALKEMCQQAIGDARTAAMSDAAKSRLTNDLTKISVFPVPLCFIGTKFDKLRDLPLADRKAALLILRFVAHYCGASVYCTSSNDATTRDSFKSVFASLCFGGAAGRVYHEVSLDKPVMVSAGSDSFQDILLGGAAAGTVEASKVRRAKLSFIKTYSFLSIHAYVISHIHALIYIHGNTI